MSLITEPRYCEGEPSVLAAQSQHAVEEQRRGAGPEDTLTFWRMHVASNRRGADTLAPHPAESGGVSVAMEVKARSDSPRGCRSLGCLVHLVTSYKGPR